jgi:hypothetical protein
MVREGQCSHLPAARALPLAAAALPEVNQPFR